MNICESCLELSANIKPGPCCQAPLCATCIDNITRFNIKCQDCQKYADTPYVSGTLAELQADSQLYQDIFERYGASDKILAKNLQLYLDWLDILISRAQTDKPVHIQTDASIRWPRPSFFPEYIDDDDLQFTAFSRGDAEWFEAHRIHYMWNIIIDDELLVDRISPQDGPNLNVSAPEYVIDPYVSDAFDGLDTALSFLAVSYPYMRGMSIDTTKARNVILNINAFLDKQSDNLRSLKLSKAKVLNLQVGLDNLTLYELDISHVYNFRRLPNLNTKHLREFIAFDTSLTEIPTFPVLQKCNIFIDHMQFNFTPLTASIATLTYLHLNTKFPIEAEFLAQFIQLESIQCEIITGDLSTLAQLVKLRHFSAHTDNIYFISSLVNLTSYDYIGPQDEPEIGLDLSPLVDLPNLTKISLNFLHIEDYSFLSRMPSLTSLELSHVLFDDDLDLRGCKLRKLHLYDICEGSETYLNSIGDMNELEELKIHRYEGGANLSLTFLCKLKNLRRLSLYGIRINEQIIIDLEECHMLEELNLAECYVRDLRICNKKNNAELQKISEGMEHINS
jgi:hypothetical protein